MNPSVAPALADALRAAGFTYDGVADLLGPEAHLALSRNETTPGRRATTGRSALETLIRLFLLQVPVPLDDAEAALPGLVDRLAVTGLLERSVSEVAARLDCRPYAVDGGAGADHFWVVSDLTPGLDGGPQRVGADHVLGISAASTSLAQLTLRDQVDSALDLGTGCGVQALHLAGHSGRVVATDVNQRALAIARFNAALNDVEIDVRDGSFFEPIRGERFDLIATNPPFVISPATGERLVYRDSGLPGDRVVEDIVRAAPSHLTPGGWCQILANWVIERDRPWEERLAGWLADDVDALIVQREVVDPPSYVELWLKDAGLHGTPEYLHRYDTWLSWFDEQGIEAVGFGWINLHHADPSLIRDGSAARELLEWPYEVEQPIAPAIGEWGEVAGSTPDADDLLLVREDVVQETLGPAGAEDPATIVLRQQRGFRQARTVDTIEAALVGACDGELTLGQILDAVASLLGRDAVQVREQYLDVTRALLREGYLVPIAPTVG